MKVRNEGQREKRKGGLKENTKTYFKNTRLL